MAPPTPQHPEHHNTATLATPQGCKALSGAVQGSFNQRPLSRHNSTANVSSIRCVLPSSLSLCLQGTKGSSCRQQQQVAADAKQSASHFTPSLLTKVDDLQVQVPPAVLWEQGLQISLSLLYGVALGQAPALSQPASANGGGVAQG